MAGEWWVDKHWHVATCEGCVPICLVQMTSTMHGNHQSQTFKNPRIDIIHELKCKSSKSENHPLSEYASKINPNNPCTNPNCKQYQYEQKKKSKIIIQEFDI